MSNIPPLGALMLSNYINRANHQRNPPFFPVRNCQHGALWHQKLVALRAALAGGAGRCSGGSTLTDLKMEKAHFKRPETPGMGMENIQGGAPVR